MTDEFDLVEWFLTLDLIFANRSEKEVRAFTGELSITDLFGRPKLEAGLSVDRPRIPSEASHRSTDFSIELNEYDDDQMWLFERGMADIEWTFTCDGVIFSDGSRWAA